MVEFALNNAVHASTGFTPFYLNGLRHSQVPLTLRRGTDASIVSLEYRARVFEKTVVIIYRQQAHANQPG
ncbi:Reverse transcriptase [Phytophthora palmivora]|uniref:Reverse transcriptase n=1 Tax=Phytophthora palmivora TaxID=4796 RepID=A0A2P4XXG5_9STRA|nr:Reverse transcriptase [Phytophthora palmivora]